jgi:hypothetical protein
LFGPRFQETADIDYRLPENYSTDGRTNPLRVVLTLDWKLEEFSEGFAGG